MELSVIILNYNASVFLELCVESCLRATQHIMAEIIVVDNDSTDDSIERLSRTCPQVKIIKLDENYGFSKGNNIAVDRATGEYICLINPDVILGEKVLEESLAFYTRSEVEAYAERSRGTKDGSKIGFLGIKLINGAGSFLPESKRRVPKPWNAFKKLIGTTSSYYDLRISDKENGPTDILVGAYMFGKRSLYLELGGLDERYFMYGEDIDLSYTALKKGYQNFYLGTQTAIHFKGESTVKDQVYDDRFYGAMMLFYEKHYPRGRFLSSFLKFLLPVISRQKKTLEQASFVTLKKYCITNDILFQPEWADKIINWQELQNLTTTSTQLIMDTRTLVLDDVMDLMSSQSSKNHQIRFLTVDRSAYAGSDSSNERGEVRRL